MMTEAKARAWEGEMPVHYLYTYGLAGERFFREVKDRGAFVATRCEACGVTYLPPRIYCERCFARLEGYLPVPARGAIGCYTICHEASDGTRLAEPQVIAQVLIRGTDGAVIHRISGVKPSEIRIGMEVEAVFEDAGRRIGGIGDILCFKPTGRPA